MVRMMRSVSQVAGFAQADVCGDVYDAETLAGEQHAGVGGVAELGNVLGVTGELPAAECDGLFVERRGDHGVGFAAQAHHRGVVDVADGGAAVFSAQCAHGDHGIGGKCVAVAEFDGERV